MRTIGVNTWIWTSPLTDANAPARLRAIAEMGFDAVEIPLEQPGDLSASSLVPVLAETALVPFVVGAMAPGRDLVRARDEQVRSTQAYLVSCLDLAAAIGAGSVCGPFYAATGRTWRMDRAERQGCYRQLRTHLGPVLEHAAALDITLGIEPLNRYETSLINTVDQALEALQPLLGPHLGLALDTYHLGIEERSIGAAVRTAGAHLKHLQVCGNDRGTPGGDQTDWHGLYAALEAIDYRGPVTIESFTGDNEAIAVAASIWRPLASSQDTLARDGLAFLREMEAARP